MLACDHLENTTLDNACIRFWFTSFTARRARPTALIAARHAQARMHPVESVRSRYSRTSRPRQIFMLTTSLKYKIFMHIFGELFRAHGLGEVPG